MNKTILSLFLSLSISACGGGSTDDMTQEELSQYPSNQYPQQSIMEQHNEMTGRKGIMPVDCIVNPGVCI